MTQYKDFPFKIGEKVRYIDQSLRVDDTQPGYNEVGEIFAMSRNGTVLHAFFGDRAYRVFVDECEPAHLTMATYFDVIPNSPERGFIEDEGLDETDFEEEETDETGEP